MARQIPPVKPYFPPEDIEKVKEYVGQILSSGMLTLGEFTRRLEEEFAKLCGVKHTVAVSSGTSALEIAYRCLGLREGDEVIVPTNTFSATAATVFFAGGRPVLTDIDPETLCITEEEVKERITGRTRGVVVVHIGGLVCPDVKAIREVCEDHGLFLVEDAAHAHGSTLDGQPAGSFGHVGCFSFYPTKVMTSGEGGVLTTDDGALAEKARVLRDQGKESFGSSLIVELGYNWRMPEVCAAIGLVQLERLEEIIERRQEIARYYDRELSRIDGIRPLKVPSNISCNYYKYVVFLDEGIDRDAFKARLRELGVRCGGEVYWPPLHLQPVYRRLLGTKEGDFPKAEEAGRKMACLPIYAGMSDGDAEYVISCIRQVLGEM
ncbi:aminotransferase DegT [Candidatus Bathyarchaeota archaeon]|nr:MAG: aminotransferase DegT [Candidatus Bathyarchaeota archaeon]